MFSGRSSTIKPHFDVSLNPIPRSLKSALEHVSSSFYNSRMRNLDMIYNAPNDKFYGLMTNYEAENFCWVQLTRTKSTTPEHEYDQYIRTINNPETTLKYALTIKPGMDCIALYEVDSHWYRAVVVEEVSSNQWNLLFIDYGNFQVCVRDNIRLPVSDSRCDHYHAPMQAICCRLYNIIPRSPIDRDEIERYMERFFLHNSNKFLEVIVRNIRHDYVIDCDIFLPKSGDDSPTRLQGKHIGQSVVALGLATFAEPEAAHAPKPTSPEVVNLVD